MTRRNWSAAIARWLHAAVGLSCPVCLLAIAVAVALGSIAGGAILLDRVRSLRQAELAAGSIADLARQRTAQLLLRIDAGLQAAATAAAAAPTPPPDTLLAQRRQAEPGLLALAVVDSAGEIVSGSAAAGYSIDALVPACLRDARIEAGQTVLKSALATRLAGLPATNVLCVIRGERTPGFAGAVVAAFDAALLQSQYAALGIGVHGTVALLDENGRTLTQVGPGVAGPGDDWAALLHGGAPARHDGITRLRRIDGPVPGFVAVSLSLRDALATWWARSALIGSSALILIAFVALTVIAVRRCEQREARRLERLAALAGELHASTDHGALTRRFVEGACELVACEVVPGDDDAPADRPPDGNLGFLIRRPDLVWIGPTALRRRHGAGFAAGDLAFLRLLACIADVERQQIGAIAVAADEIDKFRLEAERRRLAIETIQSEMSDAAFTLDEDWHFVGSNRAADKLFDLYLEDRRDRTIWEIFPELSGSPFEAECRRARRDRHPVSFEMQWLRTDTWLMARAFPRSPGLAVYLQDISRQVAADENLRQAAKMEAIGRLTGGIAHDFNNLLTVVLGNVELLELELPEHGELRDVHDQIKHAAQSAAELTHQLLAFARRQSLSPSDVDVGRLLLGLDGLLRRTLGAAISIEIRCPPTLWHARVDATQLENAILNLAINGRDAMPSGGRLTIEAANLAMRRSDIDQSGEIRPGNYVVVSVSDTGTGIAKDVLGKVFEPFFSTKPSGRGTGLGLSMVYGFATQSGGHARIASEVGRGTTVRLYLPNAAGGETRIEPRTSPEGRPVPQLPGGRENILVVEDADMVRDYAQSVLVSLGYEVSVAADGRQALALLDHGLQPDLLLTDVLLPNGMDGLKVAEQVLLRRPGLPVLYMSGYIENVDASQSRLDPQTNLLLKPFRRAGLAAMVRARLDRSRDL